MHARVYCAECGRAVDAAARCPEHPAALRMPPGFIRKQFAAMKSLVAAAPRAGGHFHTAQTWEGSFSREGGGGELAAAINDLRAEIADFKNLTPAAVAPENQTWQKTKNSSGLTKAVW